MSTQDADTLKQGYQKLWNVDLTVNDNTTWNYPGVDLFKQIIKEYPQLDKWSPKQLKNELYNIQQEQMMTLGYVEDSIKIPSRKTQLLISRNNLSSEIDL